MGYNPSSNVNLNSSDSGGVYKNRSSQPKNFEKVTRKERNDARPQEEHKKFMKEAENDVKTKDAFDEFYDESKAEAAAKAMPTLFDLQHVEEGELEGEEVVDMTPIKEMPPELKKETLSALFNEMGTKEKLASLQKEVTPEKKPENTIFAREQPDLAGISNPNASIQPVSFESAKTASAPMKTNAADMQELVDQIVAKIYTLKVEGKVDTTIALKNPPMFAGANVTITAYDTAKGQFNITFENLTQAAKNVVDMQQNQGALRNALEQKGYMVHIVVTTTSTIENKPVAEGGGLYGSREDQRQQQREREEEKEQ